VWKFNEGRRNGFVPDPGVYLIEREKAAIAIRSSKKRNGNASSDIVTRKKRKRSPSKSPVILFDLPVKKKKKKKLAEVNTTRMSSDDDEKDMEFGDISDLKKENQSLKKIQSLQRRLDNMKKEKIKEKIINHFIFCLENKDLDIEDFEDLNENVEQVNRLKNEFAKYSASIKEKESA